MLRPQVLVYTESTPNPNSIKFVVNFELVPEGSTFDYADASEAISPDKNSPLAVELFGFEWVNRVFISYNFVTITKNDETSWDDVLFDAKQVIKRYMDSGKPVLTRAAGEAQLEVVNGEQDSDTVVKIKAVLDQYVKPAVESDGGAITFSSFQEDTGIVKLLLQGSCSGCPSSTMTLKAGIENLLTRMVPEVKLVEAENA
ncbi:NifU family protein [Siphonobacter aquaeclarae]|uniref:Fe-S cluster biogenesis protein NfuA, 4Fe-4S-binding domain n=1 Tax=Siphonobacter aquaeclarae TaxID=563176 RepID=A0A1G9MEI8_9BACT|nr:NifU family protein [Siphonobacter aquaeclarae]MBO9637341.1 NifU family protein [Siphonobacter aquaeclarae]SDL72544.1 Fe-S cluster biogenesis protein NfuA, 4Fe-4S-binding domain [Siphonobacter aquaeclarae]